jgi:hypothetical protein
VRQAHTLVGGGPDDLASRSGAAATALLFSRSPRGRSLNTDPGSTWMETKGVISAPVTRLRSRLIRHFSSVFRTKASGRLDVER